MRILSIAFIVIALIFLSIFALNSGIIKFNIIEILHVLAFNMGGSGVVPNENALNIINSIRMPRILGAIVVGASLGLCGVIYQGVFTNPLVSPGILGVLSGASFGAALGMVLRLPYFAIEIICFCFALLSMGFAIFLALVFSKNNKILMLILGGIISSSLFGGLVSILKFSADPYEVLPNIVFWLMGSLAHIREESLLFAFYVLLFSFIVSFIYAKELDILCLGEDEAKSLGINVKQKRIFFIIIATICAASSVMIAGVVGWIGLVVPHIGRFIVGANHKYLILFSVFFGALFLLAIDTINRSIFSIEIPIGILTSIVGVFVFVIILFACRNKI